MFGFDDLLGAIAVPIISGIFGSEGQESANEANSAQAARSMQFTDAQAARQMDFQDRQAVRAMDFTDTQASRQMVFQKDMSGTAYQRAVADMKSAGLSPMLAYSQGGASTPSGASGSSSAGSGASGSGAQAVMGNKGAAAVASAQAALQMANVSKQNELISAQTAKTVAEKALVDANTQQSLASAGHSNAGADKIRQEIQAWMDVNRERAFIARTREWYDAKKSGYEANVSGDTASSRVSQAASEAHFIALRAKALGLEIPEKLAQAAFWRSEWGHSKPFSDYGIDTVGRAANSAFGVKRLGGK